MTEPQRDGGPSLTVEGECGTLKSAIAIVYAFSLSHLRCQLPPGGSLYVTIVEGNSLDGGANSFATTHPPSKTVPLPSQGKAFISIPSRHFVTLRGRHFITLAKGTTSFPHSGNIITKQAYSLSCVFLLSCTNLGLKNLLAR